MTTLKTKITAFFNRHPFVCAFVPLLLYVVFGLYIAGLIPSFGTLLWDGIAACIFFAVARHGEWFYDDKTKRTGDTYLCLFIVVVLMTFSFDTWHNAQFPDDASVSQYRSSMASYTAIISSLLTLLAAPVCEEILFRGCLYGHLRRKCGIIVSAAISSLMFGAAHGTSVHLISGTVFGLFLCLVFESTGRTGICIMYHMMYNALSYAPFPAKISLCLVISLAAIAALGFTFSFTSVINCRRTDEALNVRRHTAVLDKIFDYKE